MDADVVVVGAGLAGLVATCELADAGRSVVLLDQESEANLGGQAWWSFGGLFLVDSPEQRRMGISDSFELAWQDWEGTPAGTASTRRSPADHWAAQVGRAYVEWAAGEKRAWLQGLGVSFFPVVGWAERGDGTSGGHGNSVPRFHIPWGTGTGVVAPFERKVREHIAAGRVFYRPRHRVDQLVRTNGAVTGVRGVVLAPDDVAARACRATARWSASSSTAARRSSSPRAASAATTTWCGPTGPSGWAPRPPTCSPGCRPTSTAGCSPSPRRPAARSSTATGCGTTSRACATGTRSGRGTHPHPARPELDVVRRARQPAARAVPPRLRHPRHARSLAAHRFRPLLVHPQPRRSRARSSRCRGRSRTSTSPRSATARCSAGRSRRSPRSVQAFLDHGEDWLTAATIGELVRR